MVYITDPLQHLLSSLAEFDHIPYPVYRVAMKLQYVQKKTKLWHVTVPMWRSIVEEHCLENPNLVLQPAEISSVVTSLLQAVSEGLEDKMLLHEDEAARLLLSWLSVLYPQPALTALQLNIPIILLCNWSTTDKHRLLFEVTRVSGYELSLQDLSHMLHLSSYLIMSCGEHRTLGGTTSLNVSQCCFAHNNVAFSRGISLEQYEEWVMSDPPYLAWIPTLHRLNISQNMKHDAKCGICKCYPILGLRYRCLRCINLDLCQECFLQGKLYKNHDETHPLKEYIRQGSTSESIKDLTTVVKTYFKHKSTRSLRTPSEGRPKSTISYLDSQDYGTINTDEWYARKGRLPGQTPLQYTSCPALAGATLLLGDAKRLDHSHQRLDQLELQNNRLAAQVHRLQEEVGMNSPPPYHPQSLFHQQETQQSFFHQQETQLRQGTYVLLNDPPVPPATRPLSPLQSIAEIADTFSTDIGIYSGTGGERHPVICGAGNICVAMDTFLGDMFNKTPPPKPKRTSPNLSKASSTSPSSCTPPPCSCCAPPCPPGGGIDLQLAYDPRYSTQPGYILDSTNAYKSGPECVSPVYQQINGGVSPDPYRPSPDPYRQGPSPDPYRQGPSPGHLSATTYQQITSSTPKCGRKLDLDISFTCSTINDRGREEVPGGAGRTEHPKLRRSVPVNLTSRSEILPARRHSADTDQPTHRPISPVSSTTRSINQLNIYHPPLLRAVHSEVSIAGGDRQPVLDRHHTDRQPAVDRQRRESGQRDQERRQTSAGAVSGKVSRNYRGSATELSLNADTCSERYSGSMLGRTYSPVGRAMVSRSVV